MGVASKVSRKLRGQSKLKKLEEEYDTKAQPGETAREFQSRMNIRDSIPEFTPSEGTRKTQSMIKMFEGMTLKQRRAEIRELQAEGIGVRKEILDMAGMEKVNGKIRIKSGMMGGGMSMKKKMMMGGGAAMKKKMMMGGGASMKKKAYAKGGANMKKKAYAKGGANMKKKSYAAGGASMKKKMMAGGGAMKKKSYSVGGIVRANAGASVPASGGSRNK